MWAAQLPSLRLPAALTGRQLHVLHGELLILGKRAVLQLQAEAAAT